MLLRKKKSRIEFLEDFIAPKKVKKHTKKKVAAITLAAAGVATAALGYLGQERDSA